MDDSGEFIEQMLVFDYFTQFLAGASGRILTMGPFQPARVGDFLDGATLEVHEGEDEAVGGEAGGRGGCGGGRRRRRGLRGLAQDAGAGASKGFEGDVFAASGFLFPEAIAHAGGDAAEPVEEGDLLRVVAAKGEVGFHEDLLDDSVHWALLREKRTFGV